MILLAVPFFVFGVSNLGHHSADDYAGGTPLDYLFISFFSVVLVGGLLIFLPGLGCASSRLLLCLCIVPAVLAFVGFFFLGCLELHDRRGWNSLGVNYCYDHRDDCDNKLKNYTQLYCASLPLSQKDECERETPVAVVEEIINKRGRAYDSIVTVVCFTLAGIVALLLVAGAVACIRSGEEEKDKQLSKGLPELQQQQILAA